MVSSISSNFASMAVRISDSCGAKVPCRWKFDFRTMFVNEEGCVEKFVKFEHTLDARFKPQTAVGQANGCLWLS